jgi:hypothetical protein
MAACWLLLTVKGPDMLEAGLQLAFRFFGGFFEITGQQFGGYGRVEKVLAPPCGWRPCRATSQANAALRAALPGTGFRRTSSRLPELSQSLIAPLSSDLLGRSDD